MSSNAIGAALKDLLKDPNWVADSTFLSRCEWRYVDKAFVLVTKPKDGEKELYPASCKFIGEIAGESFKLVSDGKWTAKFASETPLHRAKASCFVTGGFEDDVIKIWSQQLGGFAKIQDSRKNGTNVGYAVTKDDVKEIRMRHALFRDVPQVAVSAPKKAAPPVAKKRSRKDAVESVEEGEDVIVDEDKVDLTTWPVTSEEAREALETMAADDDHNWEVVPIPAFDIKGNQIAPEDYEAKLKGSVALITVNVCHQYYRARQEDSYYADIEEIVVLKEPYVMASTPKRKHGDKVDTPSKKVRKDND